MLINRTRIILASISGLLLSFSLPKLGLWWCAWFGFVPLFAALRGLSGREAFSVGIVSGVVHFFFVLSWLFFVLQVHSCMQWWKCVSLLVMFSFYLSLYPAIFSLIISCLAKSPSELFLIAPSGWVVLEFLRGILFTGFPWGFIGYSQFEQLHIIQIADIFGVYGVSFLLVIFNVAIYVLILFLFGKRWNGRIPRFRDMFCGIISVLLILVLVILYGYWRISDVKYKAIAAEHLKIGIVQGNIEQSTKWNPAFQIVTTKKYVELSKMLSSDNPDLVVWPETSTPFYFGISPELTDFVIDAIKGINSYFVIGSPTKVNDFKSDDDRYFNSAYLVGGDGEIKGRYDKSHLVPFGEYSPLKWLELFTGKFLSLSHDFEPGIPGNVLFWRSDCSQLGIQICYEIVFPALSRLLTTNGAGLLLNLTNDAWFGYSSAAYQHFSMSVFRAVENRRSLIRAANTGISSFIDPTGQILEKTSLFKTEVLLKELPVLCFKTIYTRLGDFFVLICTVIITSVFFRHILKTRY